MGLGGSTRRRVLGGAPTEHHALSPGDRVFFALPGADLDRFSGQVVAVLDETTDGPFICEFCRARYRTGLRIEFSVPRRRVIEYHGCHPREWDGV